MKLFEKIKQNPSASNLADFSGLHSLSLPQSICNSAYKVSSLNLSCKLFSVDGIERALAKLKPKFNMGPGRIPAFILHKYALFLASDLKLLFNLTLRNIVVVPVHKKGNINHIENFRPITFLNNF